jgi:hypothetical protein
MLDLRKTRLRGAAGLGGMSSFRTDAPGNSTSQKFPQRPSGPRYDPRFRRRSIRPRPPEIAAAAEGRKA